MNMELDKFNLRERLPTAGIFVFAAGSVHSLRYLLGAHAAHDNGPLFWAIAAFVEAATAFIVLAIVESLRVVTKSRQTKENRRFYGALLAVLTLLVIPSLGVSMWANAVEFGHWALAILFPLLSVACAVLSAMPQVTRQFEMRKAAEAESDRKQAARTRKEKERKVKEKAREEAERLRKKAEKDAETRREEAERQLETQRNLLSTLGKALETLRIYADNPTITRVKAAENLGTSRVTVRNHLGKLEEMGLVTLDNGRVDVLVERGLLDSIQN